MSLKSIVEICVDNNKRIYLKINKGLSDTATFEQLELCSYEAGKFIKKIEDILKEKKGNNYENNSNSFNGN